MNHHQALIRHVYVPSGDAIIEAKIVGDGPPVVMIAGWARGISDLDQTMRALAESGFQAIGINMRGAEGSSGPFAGITTEVMVSDVEAVTQALGLARFHLLGHALGTRLARYFATIHPDRVKTVILIAAGGRPRVSVDVRPFVDAVLRTVRGELTAAETDAAMRSLNLVAPTSDARICRTGWSSNAAAMMEAWNAKTMDDYFFAGGRPMFLVYGSDDGLGPLPNVLSLREELGDQVELAEIVGAGHFLQIEKPQAVAAAVLSWLRRQDIMQ